MWAALWRHLQWRGLTLAGVGACWIAYGIGLIVTARPGLVAATAPLIRLMGVEGWGGVWMVCGVAGVACGLLRPGRDIAGFAGVFLPPTVWGLAFVGASATGTYEVAWATAPLYAAIVLLVVVVAALTGGRRRSCTCDEGAPDGH
ncbi:hypothetical protein [Streptomyces sp. NBC_01233]|uniref:hypothetical protein n=1 Tax=Streptomyces sp. NBC_01233 TaxID=2903787 RepID=UPI002E12C7EB|nr:hypothetical protein OG332_10780 [Streptomyces sp. NBC_01233]